MRIGLVAIIAAAALTAGCQQQAVEKNEAEATPNEATPNEAAPASAPAATLGTPLSGDAAKKLIHDRHENMETIGDGTKAIGRTLKTSAPDLALIRTTAGRIAQLSPDVPKWFPPGTGPDSGKTHAKAEIWQKPADFLAKAKAFDAAAQAFSQAAAGGDMAAVNTRFGEMMKTCKACHEPYRAEKND